MKYDTIFFDIGNTLYFYNYEFLCGLLDQRFNLSANAVELALAHRQAQIEVVGQGIASLPHAEVWGRTYDRWFELVGIEEGRRAAVVDSVRNHPFKHLFWARTEEGTREMLDWFRERGYKLGIISNAEGQIKRLVEHTGLISRFDAIIDSEEVGCAKPDGRIFVIALEMIGSSAERSVHVGDLLEVDVAGARGAGLTPILVDRDGSHSRAGCITVSRAVDLPSLDIFSGAS